MFSNWSLATSKSFLKANSLLNRNTFFAHKSQIEVKWCKGDKEIYLDQWIKFTIEILIRLQFYILTYRWMRNYWLNKWYNMNITRKLPHLLWSLLFLSLSSIKEEGKCLICNNCYLGNSGRYKERHWRTSNWIMDRF